MAESNVSEPRLERVGKRFGHTAGWFLAIAIVLFVPGLVLVLVSTTWSIAFGAALILLASIPGTIGVSLLVSSVISRWSARHKSFA